MAKKKISTIDIYGSSLEAEQRAKRKRISTIDMGENNGSAAGYLAQSAGIGLAGLFEGIGDFTTGTIYQLAGDREYAKYLHDRDVTGGWQQDLNRSYNPSKGMQVAGDVAAGIGQALPSVAISIGAGLATGGVSTAIQVGGGVLMGAAYAGRGITSAVQKTGELGLKENAYGVLTGASEAVTDALLGGTQKAGKMLVGAGKAATKSAGTKIARNGLLKGIWTSASSEFAEEFIQEYMDTALQRATRVDADAEYSLSNALYSGMIGGLTGGLLGGAAGSINTANNVRRGESIRARGLERQLLSTANYIRNDYLGKDANFDKIESPALRTLSAAVDAYNKLDAKEKASGMRGAMLLGEIQAGAFAFETETGIRSRMNAIMANPTEELAAYASTAEGKAVTVEDLRQNRGGVSEMLAVRDFAMNVMGESGTDIRAERIREKVASERFGNIQESAGFAEEVEADGSAVYRMRDGRYVIVTADQTEGNEGKYRLGFSETAEFDEERVMQQGGLSGEKISRTLAGLADDSLTYNNETRRVEERAKAQENAPVSNESVVDGQLGVEGANEAQRGENAGESEKVSEDNGSGRSAIPKTREARERKKKSAQAHQKQQKEKRKAERMAAAMREGIGATENGQSGTPVPTDGEARAELRGRGYTDAEANAARGLVKDFDLLQPQARRAIVEMMRSGKRTGASKTFMRHAANLIAYWRRDLWVICDDKIRDDGFFYVFDDGTRLITVKPKAEGRSISEALMHELGHDVWEKMDEDGRNALYEKVIEGTKEGEIEEIRKRYRDELGKRGDLEGLDAAEVEALLREEVAVNRLGEMLGKEEFLDRLAGGEISLGKRFLRTLSVMKKRFTGKDKYLYRKADDLFRGFTRVMAGQTLTGVNEEKVQVSGRTRYSLVVKKVNGEPQIVNPYEITRDEILEYMELAKKRKLEDNTYFPVKSQTPQTVLSSLRAAGIDIKDKPLAMQAKKAHQAQSNGPFEINEKGENIRSHALKSTEVMEAIDLLDTPDEIFREKEHEEIRLNKDGIKRKVLIPERFSFFVTLESGKVCVVVLQFDSEIDSTYILQDQKGDDYHTTVTVFAPDTIYRGKPIDYADELSEREFCSPIDVIKTESPSSPTAIDGPPAAERESGLSANSIYRKKPVVNPSSENILSEEDKNLLFDEEFYSRYENESKEEIVYDIDELEMLKGSEELSDDAVSDINAQIKALKAGYRTVYDYYIETAKKQMLEDYAKWGEKGKTYRLLEEKRKKANKKQKLLEDMSSASGLKKAQFEIIQKTNPMYDDFHTGIRSPKDIKTFQEVVEDPDSFQWGDFSREDARKALSRGTIKVYSSYAIKNGVFVSTSYKQSLEYAGNDPKGVHSKVVPLDSVAWINGDEGQFADAKANAVNRSKRSALPKVDGEEMVARAYERGMGAKSQTAENVKAEEKKDGATTTKKRKRRTNAEVRAEERARADKMVSAEKERIERDAAQGVNKASRTTARLNQQIQYLKNAVSHRKHTDGGNDAAHVLENSALKGFIKYFANRTAAYGVAHSSTREAVRGLLPWYTAENEALSGNVLDELLAKSDKNTGAIFGYYNAEVRARMEQIANGEGNLSAAELESLGSIVGAVAKLYESYGRVWADGRWQDAETLAKEQYADLLSARKALVSDTDENGKGRGAIKRLRSFLTKSYLYSAVTPEAVLRDLEGNTKSGVLSGLYRQIRLGEAESKQVQANILQPVAEFFAEKENRKYHREISKNKRFEYRGEMLTTAQAVGLYETSKRAHAQGRLFDMEKGGFRVAVFDEATGNTVTRKLKATQTDIDNLHSQFTEQDLAFIAALEESFKRSTEHKVKTDKRVLGYTNAVGGHYYPITTDENYFAKDVTDIRDTMGYAQVVYNKSFNKNTVEGAQAWLFVEDALSVLNRHASGIGAYAGLYSPLQTFGIVYGKKFDPTGQAGKEGAADSIFFESVAGKTSLREYLNSTLWNKRGNGGTGLDDYLTKLFSDIQGIHDPQTGIDKLVAKLQGGAITASFGLNLKVIATQLASYPAAYKNLDADVLTKAIGMKPDMEAMDKYSRITFARSFEGIGAAEGGLERISELGRLATKGIDLTDRQVIGRLWSACQLQAEKDGLGAFGSEENLRAAGDLLDNLLLDTQTTSLKADASALGRDKNVIAKMLTMFKTESMKSFSNLYGSFSAYVDHRRYAKAGMEGYEEMLEDDKKAIGKNVTAFLLSNAWVAAVAVAFSRIRKAARGEEEEEQIALQFAKEMGGNVADMFPVISEVTSYLMDGYDMDYMPIATINDALSMLAGVGVLADAESTAAEKNKYLRQSVITLGEIVGLPTKNAGRIALTLTSNVSKSSAYALRDRYDTSPTYQSDLDRALAIGNERLAATVLSLWFDRSKGGELSEEVSREILRLYEIRDGEGKSILSMPKNVPSSLSAKQAAAFSAVYSEADGAAVDLLGSSAYQALDDNGRAKALKACYDMAWSRAAMAVGLEDVGSAAKMASASVDPVIMAAVAGYAKAYVGEKRKESVIAYLRSLGFSDREMAVYLEAMGYKVSEK